jgi:nucleotide-binding universal stress UspA family protein
MRILLATDGSRSADVARDLVAAMPWPARTTFRIVSVAPRSANIAASWTPETAHEPEVDRYRDPVARVHAVALADAERSLSLAHPDARIERFLLRGRPASLIVREARAFSADLIVVGHRGHGTIETMVLGSVSAEVVDHAPCAVLVARSSEPGPIAFADDGSPSARIAATVLESLPLAPGTPITVLTVTDTSFPYDTAASPALYNETMALYQEDRDEAEREGRAIASAAAARLEQLGYRTNAVVHAGDPAHEIVGHTKMYRTGLLVLGTRGNTGLKRLLLGSVARNVLLHAPCSVLIVRESVVPPVDEALVAELSNKR